MKTVDLDTFGAKILEKSIPVVRRYNKLWTYRANNFLASLSVDDIEEYNFEEYDRKGYDREVVYEDYKNFCDSYRSAFVKAIGSVEQFFFNIVSDTYLRRNFYTEIHQYEVPIPEEENEISDFFKILKEICNFSYDDKERLSFEKMQYLYDKYFLNESFTEIEFYENLPEIKATIDEFYGIVSLYCQSVPYYHIGLAAICKLEPNHFRPIDSIYQRFPSLQTEWRNAQSYIISIKANNVDLYILFCNYFYAAKRIETRFKLPTLELGPSIDFDNFYRGIFIETETEMSSKDSKRLEQINNKIKDLIEQVFEAFCDAGYMENSIENLYLFTYRLTSYTPFGHEIELRRLKWGQKALGGTARVTDGPSLYYFFGYVFDNMEGHKKGRYEKPKRIFCLDPSDEKNYGHPQRCINYTISRKAAKDAMNITHIFKRGLMKYHKAWKP